jgi:hypothetical protein
VDKARTQGDGLTAACAAEPPGLAPAGLAPRATERLPTTRRATGALTAAFAFAAALGIVLGPPGCLNPRPEEDPSRSGGGQGDVAVTAPSAETCDDNPLLAGCVPSPEAPADGVDDGDQETTPAPSSDAPGVNAPEQDAGVPPDAGADAGSSTGVVP